MNYIDPRESVYRKHGKRYIPCGKLNSCHDFDGFKSPGLWLHTESDGGGTRTMTLIAKLEELQTSAVSFASAMRNKDELAAVLNNSQDRRLSVNGTAEEILKWIAGKAI